MRKRQVLVNLCKSIAPVWKPGRYYSSGTLCTYNGRRYRALVDITAERKFNSKLWSFEPIGDIAGRSPITETDIPSVYTPDDIKDKVNAILTWARSSTDDATARMSEKIITAEPRQETPKETSSEYMSRIVGPDKSTTENRCDNTKSKRGFWRNIFRFAVG